MKKCKQDNYSLYIVTYFNLLLSHIFSSVTDTILKNLLLKMIWFFFLKIASNLQMGIMVSKSKIVHIFTCLFSAYHNLYFNWKKNTIFTGMYQVRAERILLNEEYINSNILYIEICKQFSPHNLTGFIFCFQIFFIFKLW